MTDGSNGLEEVKHQVLTRQCTEIADYHAPDCISSSPYHFAPPEALNCHDVVRLLSHRDNRTEASEYRGDPPKRAKGHIQSGIDDGVHLNESTVGSQGYYTGSTADYSSYSYKSKIATFSSSISEVFIKPKLKTSKFKGEEDEPDKVDRRVAANLVTHHDAHAVGPSQLKYRLQAAALKHNDTKIKPDKKNEKKVADCYRKSTYTVLIGDTVKVYDTRNYAILPLRNHYMVKERIKDASGSTRVKMSLRTFQNSSTAEEAKTFLKDDDSLEADGDGMKHYYHKNSESPGHIIFTRDKRFQGDMKYPLPTEKATFARIGRGGNGFVFTMYHQKKQYAVKKTVYRSNEVKVHSALNHKNILALAAVLMGEKHERHSGKFYCFHFMSKMDCDLRQVLSTKEVGSLKHYYVHCSKDPEKFEVAYNNVKYVLMETLKGLEYLHSQGYVHRDVKASNIMIKMKNCKDSPLQCSCSMKFGVKLGDFDSAGTVPGLGIKEPTDQLIKFASILPLGTPGYRAPEVSMQITLSGPYETLYTTAVDMWSFGCLCLNICIGKTAALKQREEASLLLSQSHYCSTELWEKTTKIGELQNTRPFNADNQLISLVRSCLQVNSKKRPTALQAQQCITIKRG